MKKSSKQNKKQNKKDEALIHVLLLLGIIAVCWIGMFRYGLVGTWLNGSVRVLFGAYPMVVFSLVILLSVIAIFGLYHKIWRHRYSWAILMFLLSAQLLMGMLFTQQSGLDVLRSYVAISKQVFSNVQQPAGGGLTGAMLYALSSYFFARKGSAVVVAFLIVSGSVILFGPAVFADQRQRWGHMLQERKTQRKTKALEKQLKQVQKDSEKRQSNIVKQTQSVPSSSRFDEIRLNPKGHHEQMGFLDLDPETPVAKKKDIQTPEVVSAAVSAPGSDGYQLPALSLLDKQAQRRSSHINTQAAAQKGTRLLEILQQFGISAELVTTHIGPSVTKFEIKPDSSVKISKILSVQDNLMMELAVKELRIEAPIPGKSAVGIEVPNAERIPVRLAELIGGLRTQKASKLSFVLGKNLMGETVFGELDKMPHLLIAGATGSGKSVCVNSIIVNFLLRARPDEVKLVLIDPKKVEFTSYAEIPHLICPVISDPSEAAKVLDVVVHLMENRYDVFAKNGVRNISGYNELAARNQALRPMPWIVLIIDELADLMAVAGKDVEKSIQRITQLARAAGIHLIVATQRPSVDVITGVIKANIPTRIAFAVSSSIDSRTILDQTGAEKLLGHGDMLYQPIGEPSPIRVQGVFVSDDEINRICAAASAQQKPTYDDAFINLEAVEGNEGVVGIQDDPVFEEAKAYVIDVQKASTSLLQRRFQLGYNRAARIIEALEEQGVIGPAQGSKPRTVYIKAKEHDE